MQSNAAVFIGLEPNTGSEAIAYAALDVELQLTALAEKPLREVLDFLKQNNIAAAAINSPSGINRGLVREKMVNEMRAPHQIRRADMRMAEYELRQRGVSVTGAPGRIELCPAWMQAGFTLYRNLEEMGFRLMGSNAEEHFMLETNPHGCFQVLLGINPLLKSSLEGRIQRQVALHEKGVRIKDPMAFFEEITRYKLIKGHLPVEMIFTPEQLDALVAAYLAWLSVNEPAHIQRLGQPEEGEIILPASDLMIS